MDSESLKGLGTLLLWGGVIFLMMRYGCGAHMMRGQSRHGHGRTEGAALDVDVIDPVCSMTVKSCDGSAGSIRYGCESRAAAISTGASIA